MLKVKTWETTIIPKVCALARSRLSLSWKWDQIRTKLNQIQMLTKYKNGLRLLGNVYLGEHQFLLGVVEAGGGLDWTSLDQVVAQLGKSGKKHKFCSIFRFASYPRRNVTVSDSSSSCASAFCHWTGGQQWSAMINNGQQWSQFLEIKTWLEKTMMTQV